MPYSKTLILNAWQIQQRIDPFLKYPVKGLTTVALINRDHYSYPAKADFVGVSLATTLQEHITVELAGGKNDAVYLM